MLALSAQAHSEKEHMKTAENPDCESMKMMDHSKMDMNDPVSMAMMQQCMSSMQNGSAGSGKKSDGHTNSDKEGNGSHGHSEQMKTPSQ